MVIIIIIIEKDSFYSSLNVYVFPVVKTESSKDTIGIMMTIKLYFTLFRPLVLIIIRPINFDLTKEIILLHQIRIMIMREVRSEERKCPVTTFAIMSLLIVRKL